MAGEIPKADLWKYSSFWYKSFDDMSLKTMLRQLISRWGIMSIELQTAYERDEALLHEDGTFEYVENADATKDQNVINITPETSEDSGSESIEASFFDNGQA